MTELTRETKLIVRRFQEDIDEMAGFLTALEKCIEKDGLGDAFRPMCSLLREVNDVAGVSLAAGDLEAVRMCIEVLKEGLTKMSEWMGPDGD